LFVSAFEAFNAQEAAAGLGNEFVPFCRVFSPPLGEIYFPEAYAIFLEHVAAFFAFEAQGLFFGGFSEFVLKRVFLSAVALFFSFVVAFAFG
jgi:hypothetical protein